MLLAILLFVLSSSFCEDIDNGWKGLQPLRVTKNEFEKKIGVPGTKQEEYYYFDYQTEDAYFQANFSSQPCRDDKFSRGKFYIPEGTLLDYSVIIKARPKVSELKFDRAKFVKLSGGHVPYLGTYQNASQGIDIAFRIESDGSEVVEKIYFQPSKADAEKFKCTNVPSF